MSEFKKFIDGTRELVASVNIPSNPTYFGILYEPEDGRMAIKGFDLSQQGAGQDIKDVFYFRGVSHQDDRVCANKYEDINKRCGELVLMILIDPNSSGELKNEQIVFLPISSKD